MTGVVSVVGSTSIKSMNDIILSCDDYVKVHEFTLVASNNIIPYYIHDVCRM